MPDPAFLVAAAKIGLASLMVAAVMAKAARLALEALK